jgi:hypothetical protein
MIRSVLLFLVAARVFAADPFFFVQASDPQFGMYTSDRTLCRKQQTGHSL